MNDSSSKSSCDYESTAWKELPIDGSLNQLAVDLECSRNLIRGALRGIEGRDQAGNNPRSLYDLIIEGRREGDPTIPKEQYGVTRPVALYWEIIPLIAALVETRKTHRGLSGEALAQETITLLADLLDVETYNSSNDFFDETLWASSSIQNALCLLYKDEIQVRLNAIIALTSSQPAENIIKNMYALCASIDAIISNLEICPLTATSESSSNDIMHLYDELVSVREQVYIEKTFERSKFDFHKFSANDTVATELTEALNRYSKTDRSHGTPDLEEIYSRYLSLHSASTQKQSSFKETFSFFKSYVTPHTSIETFQSAITKELHNYALAIFDNLYQIDHIDYSYSTYRSSGIQDLYISQVIRYCHDRISYAVHLPMTRLRDYFLLHRIQGDYLVPSTDLQNFSKNLIEQIDILANAYLDLPLLRTDPSFDPTAFIDWHHDHAFPIFKETFLLDDLQTLLNSLHNFPSNYIAHLPTAALLLTNQCAAVVSHEIEICIQHLTSGHQQLTQFYNNISNPL